MIGPVRSKSTALVLREPVRFLERGRKATTFHSPFGVITAPSDAISNREDAYKLVEMLDRQLIESAGKEIRKGKLYSLDAETHLVLRKVNSSERGARNLLFSTATEKEFYAKAFYVLPKNKVRSFVQKIGAAEREYFYDPIGANQKTAALLEHIEIDDKEAADFVAGLVRKPSTGDASCLLIYHNYLDEKSKDIQLKADALVHIKIFKQKLFRGDIAVFLVHRLPGTEFERLPFEILVEDYPPHAILCDEDIRMSRKQYEGIYNSGPADDHPLMRKVSQEEWPFPVKLHNLVELKDPSLTFWQKFKAYKNAVIEDSVFGLACIGSLMQSIGKGLIEGFLLPAVTLLGQNTLGVLSTVTLVVKFKDLFHLWGNSRGAAQVEQLDAKETKWADTDKQFPLWDTGARYKVTTDLIKKYTAGSLYYLAAGGLFFLLAPPVFVPMMLLLGPAAGIAYIGIYALHEFMNSRTDGMVFNNMLKITESRIRQNPKFKKNFWTIRAFNENLETIANQVALGVGVGGGLLVNKYALASQNRIMFAVGLISLALYGCRLVLRLFGRNAKTRLDIGQTDFLRYGKLLRLTDNIFLQLGEDLKVPIIEQDKKDRIVIPDFEKHGVKLKIAHFDKVIVKKSWLARILRFDFAQKQSVIIKTKDPSEPSIMFKLYGKPVIDPKKIEELYIEKVNEGNAVK